MNGLLEFLNPQQREAVEHFKGPALVLAGAGSGKTRVLTHRIAYLIENHGINPKSILAVTFTNKAAREMKERVGKLLKGEKDVWLSTFHSACLRILRNFINAAGYKPNFSITDDRDQLALVKRVCNDLEISEKVISPSLIQGKINWCKNNLVSVDDYINNYADESPFTEKIGMVYQAYQKELKKNNLLDFGDLIYLAVEIFSKNREILNYYRNRIRFILVDEYQDTNYAQYKLLNLLAGGEGNLFVVGDEDQSIYGWRGALIDNILNFEKDYSDAKVYRFEQAKIFRLEQNYRSTKVILGAANALISNNCERKGKTLWTENPDGEKITFHLARDEEGEASFIADSICQLEREDFSLKDIAIFYRTNSQSRAIEDLLVKKGISYSVYGGVKFYERAEVKNIIGYIKVLVNPSDSISLKRIIHVPPRGIGAATVEKIEELSKSQNITFFEAMKHAATDRTFLNQPAKRKIIDFLNILNGFSQALESKRVSELVELIASESGYKERLEEEGTDALNRIENIKELINASASFDGEGVERFLEHVALVTGADKIDTEKGNVSLMTLHMAKGLEFNAVFITGLEEGLFPHAMSSDNDRELEEERRLFYVGITRGKRKVFLSSAGSRKIHGRSTYRVVSRFIKELPENLLEHSGDAASYDMKKRTVYFDRENHVRVLLEFNSGDIVRHEYFGEGRVERADNEKVVVRFESGKKNLMIKYANLEKV